MRYRGRYTLTISAEHKPANLETKEIFFPPTIEKVEDLAPVFHEMQRMVADGYETGMLDEMQRMFWWATALQYPSIFKDMEQWRCIKYYIEKDDDEYILDAKWCNIYTEDSSVDVPGSFGQLLALLTDTKLKNYIWASMCRERHHEFCHGLGDVFDLPTELTNNYYGRDINIQRSPDNKVVINLVGIEPIITEHTWTIQCGVISDLYNLETLSAKTRPTTRIF